MPVPLSGMGFLFMMKFFRKKSKKDEAPGSERTLKDVSNGECVRIECLRGEAHECQRLREMGFCESAVIERVSSNGAVICKVCESRIVLSEVLAQKIVVAENVA